MPNQKVCQFYLRGDCKFGTRCKFSHSQGGGGQQHPRSQNRRGQQGTAYDNGRSRRNKSENHVAQLSTKYFTGFGPPGGPNGLNGDVSAEELKLLRITSQPQVWMGMLSAKRQEMDSWFSQNQQSLGGAGGMVPSAANPFMSSSTPTSNPFMDSVPVSPFQNPSAASATAFASSTTVQNSSSGFEQSANLGFASTPGNPKPSSMTTKPQTDLNHSSATKALSNTTQISQGTTFSDDLADGFVFVQGRTGMTPSQEREQFALPEFTLDSVPENILILSQ